MITGVNIYAVTFIASIAMLILLLTLSSIVLYFAFSVGKRNDYYSGVSLGNENGLTYLIKEYGPTHKLFILLIFGSILITVGIIIYSVATKKNVLRRVILYLMMIEHHLFSG